MSRNLKFGIFHRLSNSLRLRPAPRLFRDSNGCPEVRFDLTNSHVDPSIVLSNVEIEVFILDPAVATLWQLALKQLG